MFHALRIEFEGGFTTGASSSWTTDSDVISEVPEPPAAGLFGAGLLLLGAASFSTPRRSGG
jgi:hypothetical protein